MQRPTEKEVIELSKEWCYFQPNGPKCDLNCDKCRKYGAWMGYKVPVVRLIKKWERMKNERD